MRLFLVLVLVAFTLASSGVQKLFDNTNDSAVLISTSLQDSIFVNLEKCCDSEKSDVDIDKPRCLGDNCISSIGVLPSPEVYSNKIWPITAQIPGNIESDLFLRPPIV